MCHCTWRFRILGNLSANWQLQIRINFSGLPENQNTAFPLTSSRRLSAPPGHSRLVARSRSTFLASEDNFRWKCWSHSSRQSRLRHVYLMRFSISNPRWKLPDMTIHPSLLWLFAGTSWFRCRRRALDPNSNQLTRKYPRQMSWLCTFTGSVLFPVPNSNDKKMRAT